MQGHFTRITFWLQTVLPNKIADHVVLPEHLIHQHPEVEDFVIIDGNEDGTILGEQIAGEGEALVHELDPQRVPPRVILVHKAVVIDEVAIAGIVGRIDVDALDLPGVGDAQGAQGIEVIALDDEIFSSARAHGQFRHFLQRDEIGIQRAILLNRIPLPHQPQFFPIPGLQQRDQLLFRKVPIQLPRHAAETRKETFSMRGKTTRIPLVR